jgi:hypothetical protein
MSATVQQFSSVAKNLFWLLNGRTLIRIKRRFSVMTGGWVSPHTGLQLCLQSFCDGRFFIDRLDGLKIAHVNHPVASNGQYKSPDFVCQDAQGYFHLIECKGTQSSSAAWSIGHRVRPKKEHPLR